MADSPLRLAIVGAATAAAAELARALEEAELPLGTVRPLDGPDALGDSLDLAGEERPIEALGPGAFTGLDAILVLPGPLATPELLREARASGAFVLDASLVSRTDAAVPLVLPGVNDERLDEPLPGRTLAVPSPAAALLARVLLPLAAKAGLSRVEAVFLEPVSHAGLPGIEELSGQTASLLNGKEAERATFPQRIAFNVVPQVGPFGPNGETTAERMVANEVARLLPGEVPPVAATSALVPVFYGQTLLLSLGTKKPLGAADARAAFAGEDGVKVLDEPGEGIYPMPVLALGDAAAHVGRFRATPSGLALVASADDLFWGTAVPLAALLVALRERSLV